MRLFMVFLSRHYRDKQGGKVNEKQDEIFIIHFFDLPSIGTGSKKLFQPHITFLAHVLCTENMEYENILREVAKTAQETKPFSLDFERVEYFGINADKPVAQLSNSPESQALHMRLLDNVTSLGLELGQPFYAGTHFQPHMTLEVGSYASSIETHEVDTFTVAVSHGNNEETTEVIGNFALNGS